MPKKGNLKFGNSVQNMEKEVKFVTRLIKIRKPVNKFMTNANKMRRRNQKENNQTVMP